MGDDDGCKSDPFYESPLFQFLIGGATMTLVAFVANQKGRMMVQLAAVIATLPLMDMLPVLFIEEDVAQELLWRNALANVGVVAAMATFFGCVRGGLSKAVGLVIGLLAWLLVAGGLTAVVDYFHVGVTDPKGV
jgi:hypothetical protein